MNIIVRMPNWIGDLVMATPILADLRQHFYDASITAMCKRPLCTLLEKDPSINELFCFSKPNNSFLRRQEHRNIIAKIRAGKYDIGILLTNSFSSAWWFWQGKVERRIGFAKHGRSLLLTDALPMPPKGSEHEVLTYKQLLVPIQIPVSPTAPQLFVSDEEVEVSKQLLYQRGYKKGRPLIGINIGASYGSAKCWPVERFRKLAHKLLDHCPERYLLFFGDYTTAPLVKEIANSLPKQMIDQVIDLAGVTNLRELACLIKDCALLITNDSGPMHIAAAFHLPIVALFGSTDDRATGPYGQPEAVIHKRPSCSPCFKRVCPIDFRCMLQITVEEVAQKAESLLRESPRV